MVTQAANLQVQLLEDKRREMMKRWLLDYMGMRKLTPTRHPFGTCRPRMRSADACRVAVLQLGIAGIPADATCHTAAVGAAEALVPAQEAHRRPGDSAESRCASADKAAGGAGAGPSHPATCADAGAGPSYAAGTGSSARRRRDRDRGG